MLNGVGGVVSSVIESRECLAAILGGDSASEVGTPVDVILGAGGSGN